MRSLTAAGRVIAAVLCSASASSAQSGPVELRFADARCGHPVERVEVRAASSNEWLSVCSRQVAGDEPAAGLAAWVRETGQTVPRSPSGYIVETSEPVWVLARADDVAALVEIHGSEPSPLHVELVPLHEIGVRVVDASGAPVQGILVRVMPEDRERFARTDGNGHARLELLSPSEPALVTVDLLGNAPAHALLPGEPVPGSIELRLPPHGSMVVRVRDSHGALVDSDGRDWITAGLRGRGHGPLVPVLRAPLRNGQARFEHVSSSSRIKIGTNTQTWSSWDIVAPPAPGERTVHELTAESAPEEYCEVTGVVMGPEGKALAEQRLRLKLDNVWKGNGNQWGRVVQTDRRGRFRDSVWIPRHGHPVYCELELEGAPPLHYERTLQPLTPAGVDLGAVTLREKPLIAAGIIVDDQNQPLEDVFLQLVATPSSDPEGEWHRVRTVHGLSDENGRFALLGDLERTHARAPEYEQGSSYRYALSSEFGFSPTPAFALTPGDSDMTLRIPREGSVTGSVRLDEGIEATQLVVDLVGGSQFGGAYARGKKVGPSGDFRLDRLKAGLVDLEVRVSHLNTDEPVAIVEGVRIVPGEITSDPRLDPIDLRDKLHRIELQVVDEEGAAWSGHVLAADNSSIPVQDGRAVVISAAREVDVRIYLDDERYVSRHGARDGDRIVVRDSN